MNNGFSNAPMPLALALQFLAPGAGLLAASLAVPALLFFYFLKLRRRPMRVSSTLFWEQAVHDLQVNAPFRWIRPSLLLLLQLLILLCLVIAVARPAIEGGHAEERVAILVDASASMGAIDDNSGLTRLARSKAAALEYLDRLPPETEVIVVEIAGRTTTLTNFTRNRGLARAAIQRVEQSDQPARLADALQILTAFVSGPAEDGAGSAQDGESAAPPRVVLFSDGAFPDPPEDRSVAGIGDIEFDFVFIGPPLADEAAGPGGAPVGSGNVAVVGLSVRRDLDDPAMVSVFTRIQSTYPRDRPVALRCSLDGEVVAVATVTLPSAQPDQADPFLVPASETTYTFDVIAPRGGLLAVSVGIDDALAADNRAWLTLPPPESLSLLMIRPDGPLTNGSANLAFALETIYPAPQRVRVVSESEAAGGNLLNGSAETGFDIVVYDSVSPPLLPEVPALFFNAAPPVPGIEVAQPTLPVASEFLFWRRSHPVMRNVIPDGVVIYRRSTLTLPEQAREGQPQDQGQDQGPVVRTAELASDPSPLIALLEYRRTRNIVVAFDLDSTNWWQDRSFPIFVQNTIDFLSLARDTQAGRVISTTDPIRVSASEAAGGASLVDADGNTIRIPAPTSDEPVVLPPLRRAGMYELLPTESSPAPRRLIPVNLLSPFESLCAAVPSIEIGGRSMASTDTAGPARREIWDWFVLAAAALLLLEWLIFDRKMRV